MRRIGEKSRFVLILLIGLVILLHSILPHHHHFDSYSDDNNSNFSTTQIRGVSLPTRANKYCHALNNIVFKKVNSITVDSNTASNALLFVITASNLVKFYNRVLFTTFPIKDIVILKQYLSADLSVRGPPAIV